MQIENEYGDIEKPYGDGAKPYAMWAANMALSQDIGVPWIMCQQYDAPDHVVRNQELHAAEIDLQLHVEFNNYPAVQ